MEMMPLKDIKVSNTYLRLDGDVETLVKSIELVGLINPLTVNQEGELLAGGRRYTALKQLGLTEVSVNIVDRSTLQQELISIDENLVRKSLDKIELETSLNRGREIYEEINPTAEKIEISARKMSREEKKEDKEREQADTTSFAAMTAEKTGLSKSTIKSAIKRDALASQKVKKARGEGKISASQTNEIIRLKKEEQDAILPYMDGVTVQEVKKIIDTIKSDGVAQGISVSQNMEKLPREFAQLRSFAKKTNKLVSKILLEEITYEGQEKEKICADLMELKSNLMEVLKIQFDEDIILDELLTQKRESEIAESLN